MMNTAITFENLTALEQSVFREHRWWTLAELIQAEERIVPEDLAVLIARIIAGDIPEEPVIFEQSLWQKDQRPG
jgi:hypothetical protein